MNTGWFAPAGFVSNTPEKTQPRYVKSLGNGYKTVYTSSLLLTSRPHVPKDRYLKKGQRLHVGKKRNENCTYGTDFRGQNVPSFGLFLGTERIKFKLVSYAAVFVSSHNAPPQQFECKQPFLEEERCATRQKRLRGRLQCRFKRSSIVFYSSRNVPFRSSKRDF